MFFHEPAHAFILSPEHEDRRPHEVRIPVLHVPACIGSGDPDAAFLQLLDRIHDIGHFYHGHIFERPRGRLRNSLIQTGRPPFGDDDAVNARGFCRAQNGAEIPRILHPVEDKVERQLSTLRGYSQYTIHRGVFVSGGQGDNALVKALRRLPAQRIAAYHPDLYAPAFRKPDDFSRILVRSPVFSDQQPLNRPAGAERLGNRVDAEYFFSLHEMSRGKNARRGSAPERRKCLLITWVSRPSRPPG